MSEIEKLRELTVVLTSNGYLTDQTKAWQYAFDSVRDLVCIVNPYYKIKFINKSLSNKLGGYSTTIINERLSSVLNGALLSESEEEMALGGAPVYYGESYIDVLGGWYKRSRYCIEDNSGIVIGYTFMLTDVTKRKLVELKLKDLTDRLQNMVSAADGYLWEKERCEGSKEFIHKYVDLGFCRDFYGIDNNARFHNDSKTTGSDLLNEFRKDGRLHTFGDLCVSTDEHVIQQGVPCDYYEMGYIEHKRGEPKWFILRVRKTPIFNDEGECISIIGFANDCSNNPQSVKLFIEKGLVTGRVKKLSTNTEQAKVYWITNNDEDMGKSLTHVDFP